MKLLINNKEYGLQWGMGCFEIFQDTMDCGMDGLDLAWMKNRDQNKYFCNLVYAAMKCYAKMPNHPELDVSYVELQIAIDEGDQSVLTEIEKDFLLSKYQGRTMADYLGVEYDEGTKGFKKKSI